MSPRKVGSLAKETRGDGEAWVGTSGMDLDLQGFGGGGGGRSNGYNI